MCNISHVHVVQIQRAGRLLAEDHLQHNCDLRLLATSTSRTASLMTAKPPPEGGLLINSATQYL